jgi:hypothetical protein
VAVWNTVFYVFAVIPAITRSSLSVPYPLRYLFATNPKVMSPVLTIVHRVISTFLIKRARMTVKSGAQSGAVTLIQRFGSALNLDPHFHMLYLNGVYDTNGYFWPVKPPTCEDLDVVAHTIARRVSRFLEKRDFMGCSRFRPLNSWLKQTQGSQGSNRQSPRTVIGCRMP